MTRFPSGVWDLTNTRPIAVPTDEGSGNDPSNTGTVQTAETVVPAAGFDEADVEALLSLPQSELDLPDPEDDDL